MDYWQESMLKDLISYFKPKTEVLGLLLIGSFSQADDQPDDWTDIDLLAVLKEDSLDTFFSTVEWISFFGKLYTYSQSSGDFSRALLDWIEHVKVELSV